MCALILQDSFRNVVASNFDCGLVKLVRDIKFDYISLASEGLALALSASAPPPAAALGKVSFRREVDRRPAADLRRRHEVIYIDRVSPQTFRLLWSLYFRRSLLSPLRLLEHLLADLQSDAPSLPDCPPVSRLTRLVS